VTALRRWWLPALLVGMLVIPMASYPHRAVELLTGRCSGAVSAAQADEQAHELIPSRMTLRRAAQYLRSTLFAAHETRLVVVGRDHTLFYRGEGGGDGHTLDDLRGEVPFSADAMARIRSELERRAVLARSWGGRYMVAVVPNKEAVLVDLLPRRWAPPPGAVTRTAQLTQAIPAEVLLDLRPALIEARAAHPDLPVFLRQDSHWTTWGAAVACAAIRARLDNGPLRLDPRGWSTATTAPGGRDGDLATLLARDGSTYPTPGELSTIAPSKPPEPTYVSPFGHDLTVGGLVASWDQAYLRRTYADLAAPATAGTLVVLHDSFGAHEAVAWLALGHPRSEFVWSHGFDQDELATLRPQVVVHLIVARYLDLLLPRS
jgi:hypothetical protein